MDKETCQLDYETEYKKLQEKIGYMEGEYERKLRINEQTWKRITDEQKEKIKWLKSVINGILHI